MANSKMTKKDWFEVVKGIVVASGDARVDEMVAFIDHEVELLNKRSAKSGQTKTQKENVGIMDTIKEVLVDMGKPVTITEMQADERLAGFSNQKLSALVKQLVAKNEVVRTEDKKKAFFSIA